MVVIIYTGDFCGYSVRAKQLLNDKSVVFEEINVSEDPALRKKMRELAGGLNTVPQIFINGKHIGGCDDLYALEATGELDRLLS